MLQFFMHKKIPVGFVILFFTCLFFIGAYYYLTVYPRQLTTNIYQSIKLQTSLDDYLVSKTTLIQGLKETNVDKITFRDVENKVCREIQLKDINDELKRIKRQKTCNRFCLDINPTKYIHGSFCVEVDENNKITKKEEPYFWNEL